MISRREFLKSAGMAVAGLVLTRGNAVNDASLIPCHAEIGHDPLPEAPQVPTDRPVSPKWWLIENSLGKHYITWNLAAPDVEWHEIELYGYWSRDEFPLGNHYSLNLEPPRYVSVFGGPSRLILDWEWVWYQARHNNLCWYRKSAFPLTNNDRIEALGRYLGYL